MELKKTLENSWKYLPIGSAIAYEKENRRKNEFGSIGKALFHSVYPAIVGAFLVASLIYGTPNVTKWPQISERRVRARQEYNQIYERAFRCVEQDGIEGLTSLKEIDELYSRAGRPIKIDYISQDRRLSGIPVNINLTKTDLERVVASCEAEGKLE